MEGIISDNQASFKTLNTHNFSGSSQTYNIINGAIYDIIYFKRFRTVILYTESGTEVTR